MAHTRLDNPFLSDGAVITGLVVVWIYVLLVSSLMNLESWALIASPYVYALCLAMVIICEDYVSHLLLLLCCCI